MYDLYRTRDNLHRKAYQHKTKRAIEQMSVTEISASVKLITVFMMYRIKHALGEADAFIRLPGEMGYVLISFKCLDCISLLYILDRRATVKMSEAVDDMYAFTHLTDSVLQIIKLYPEEVLYLLVKDIDDVQQREVKCVCTNVLVYDLMMTSSIPHLY